MINNIFTIILISFIIGCLALFSRKPADLMELFRPHEMNDVKIKKLPPIRYYQKIQLPQVLKFRRNKKNIFIDVRESRRFKYGRIPGAVNLPLNEIENLSSVVIEKLKKSPNVILYCFGESCDLAESAAVILYRKGVRNLNVYFAGWSEWKSCALPVEGNGK